MFGCPLCELEQRIPSNEFPVWRAYSEIEPLGLEGLDLLLSRQTYFMMSSHCKMPPEVTPSTFMLPDPYRDGTLSLSEFKRLDQGQIQFYMMRHQLTDDQFESMPEDMKSKYCDRLFENMKAIIH